MKQAKILKRLLNSTTISNKTIFIISISGGKDSKATLASSLPLLLEIVSPDQIKVIFSDTSWEKDSTYKEIDSIRSKLQTYNIEFKTLKNEKYPNGLPDLIKSKKAFPIRNTKFCTELLKMIPAIDYYKELYSKGFEIISLVGKRRDESEDRKDIKDKEIYNYKDWSFTIFHPIADWSETDVYSFLEESWGIPSSYFEGNRRVGCDECFQADLKSISLMSEDKIQIMEAVEKEISQYYDDKAPTFFFRRNKNFPDGFAPIREIVNYAKEKYNFNYFTFHTRALKKMSDKIGQKALRYKFIQYGYIPDKTNFSKYVNGKKSVPQNMQFDIEVLATKILTYKERTSLLVFEKLDSIESEDNQVTCDCESYNLL